MAELPVGTVTFLFTDIEGSTRRWEQDPDAMRVALARHDGLLREAITAAGGHVFKTVGDAFHAAFETAPDAIAAAAETQSRLLAEPWGDVGPLRVRIALHTGAAELRDDDYFGQPLNRVARVLSTGHGGQVLLTLATEELARDQLPDGASLRDLGLHRLKDLTRPERIFQLEAPALPADFPPLRTLDARPNNLPAQPTPLVGREREVAAAMDLLLSEDVRLLTLTGPGGTGKTRLAMHVAADSIDNFEQGVYLVDLAAIDDPELVAPSIAQTLGVEDSGGPLVDSLYLHLRGRQMLLVLDNFEQVLSAAPFVADLLARCPRLKVLVTSRAVLHLRGERELSVPPLALPDSRRLRAGVDAAEVLSQYSAVALFLQRAVAVRPDFAVTNQNAPAIAEISARLDGLPLAIELAAARVKLLPPEAMLARLAGSRGPSPVGARPTSLQLLTGGARDLPERHQTLRGTIGWSYDLLETAEQALFRRLSVFVGGFTLEAAEAVAGPHDVDALDGVASLVDKSLVRQDQRDGEEPFFAMLETIRAFGLECLEASGEGAEYRRRHAEYILALAEEGERNLRGPGQARWLARLETEHENIRAVLGWTQTEPSAAEIGLRLAAALWWFWYIRGHWSEGRRWLEAALRSCAPDETATRAWALLGSAVLSGHEASLAAARLRIEEGMAIFRNLGDRRGVAISLFFIGNQAVLVGDHATAESALAESQALLRQVADRWSRSLPLGPMGRLALQQGDTETARARFQEALALRREAGDEWGAAQLLNSLGDVARTRREYEVAAPLYEESLALFRKLGSKGSIPSLLHNLGQVALAQGAPERAEALFGQSLALFRYLGDERGMAECVAGLAGVAAATGQPQRAARLLGATEALLEALGVPISPSNVADYERSVARARQQLDEQTFASAWAEGSGMRLEAAIGLALQTPAVT